jgi:hypothetical protein
MSELPLSDQAIVRLADRVAARHPDDVALLERLVRIPSVSGPDPDSEALGHCCICCEWAESSQTVP